MSSQGYQGSGSSVPPVWKLNYDDCLEDIDLEYLQMLFPGISDGSLVGVLLANDGDLDASIEMLNHLESDVVEPSENLPDTLDIGDVPDSDSKSEPAQPKLKNGAGESSTSTPSPAGPSSVGSSPFEFGSSRPGKSTRYISDGGGTFPDFDGSDNHFRTYSQDILRKPPPIETKLHCSLEELYA